VRSGAGHLILTDEGQGEANVPMPMILATSAVHSWLTRQGLRTFCSLNVRSAECIDPHYFAVLIGCGATTVNAYLAQDSSPTGSSRGLLEGTLTETVARYRKAIDQGLLKIMSKMGISVISSYRGGLNFEAVGLSRAMVAEFFPGMISRISGIGVPASRRRSSRCTRAAGSRTGRRFCPSAASTRRARSGETHAWEAQTMHMLQMACNKASYELWKQYSAKRSANPPIHLRDLLDIKPLGAPVPIEEVESITSIRKRFVTPGMSLGALSPRGAQDAERRDEPDRREVRFAARAARTRRISCRSPMATTRPPRSSRSRRAASA
jgi:glutamate synthase (NADPH/NADH) large chain